MTDPGDRDSGASHGVDEATLDASSWVPSGPDSPFTGSTDDG